MPPQFPPRTKAPFSVDNVSGAQLVAQATGLIEFTIQEYVDYSASPAQAVADYLIEYPVGSGFVSKPAGAVTVFTVYVRQVGQAVGTIKTFSGTHQFQQEENKAASA